MMQPVFRLLIPGLILVMFTAGCASFPGSRVKTEMLPETETLMVGANSDLDTVNQKSADFYSALNPVLQEIKEFCSSPGWGEFEQILLENPSLRDSDNQIDITPEIEARFAAWGRKWRVSWEQEFTAYHDLVDKCIILEAKKLAVRERLLVAQAKFVAATTIEGKAQHAKQSEEIYSLVQLLDKTAAELDSYQVDDLGLYNTQ